ncbi:MAG TPA: UDP-N-acetylglucosamine 2-epimerase (non-hydrolyzing) [Thermoanaerobaculia bacterium]|nr:UDP-N-acetylglucosamine 2-epimerase (non-hydrolyzing) [Thermoanaerobaculia bacterium]
MPSNRSAPAQPLKVLAVYGTRPEAIKMAPVIEALRRRPETFAVRVCTTGQHREMLDQVQELFGLVPDLDLQLMQPDQTLNGLSAAALAAMDRVLATEAPDWLLVQGDTTTAMTAGLAAFHRGIRVGHVEAGLRTGDLRHPFPEEANRRIIDLLADALFAPTERSRQALLAEGCDPGKAYVVGNTVIDALQAIATGAEGDEDGSGRREVLVTVHRRESFGEPIREIFSALRELAEVFPEVDWVYPVHRNPNVRGPAHERLSGLSNLHLIEPLDYKDLVRRLERCHLVLTDSGGIQEEAPTFGKPVLVLRETTERPEGVDAGVARLVGADRARIVAEASRLLRSPDAYQEMARAVNPYGDGRAAERIAAILAGERAGEGWEPFDPGASSPGSPDRESFQKAAGFPG